MAKKKAGIALIGYAFMGKTHSNAYRQVDKYFDPEVEPEMKVLVGRNEETSSAPPTISVGRNTKPIGAAPSSGRHRHRRYRHARQRTYADGDCRRASRKTVFCEKPLGNDFDQAKQMMDAVDKANVVNMVCFNYRRVPAIALAKRMIENGDLGRIYHFRARYLQDWIADPSFRSSGDCKKRSPGRELWATSARTSSICRRSWLAR